MSVEERAEFVRTAPMRTIESWWARNLELILEFMQQNKPLVNRHQTSFVVQFVQDCMHDLVQEYLEFRLDMHDLSVSEVLDVEKKMDMCDVYIKTHANAKPVQDRVA